MGRQSPARIQRRRAGLRDAYSGLGFADESRAVLAKVLARPGAVMRYTYDFGDEWEHDIVLEKVLPSDPVPRLSCLAGKGACPPEDCGGHGDMPA
jgi:pRiA4b ORF-3-like protein